MSKSSKTSPVEVRAGFSIRSAVAWSGLSRSAIYREAAAGRLVLRKLGRSTIVDGASLAALVNALPVADLGRKAG